MANRDRELQKMLFARCADDAAFWFDCFAWTIDPREATAKMPMVLFPRQRELLIWLGEREAKREGGVVEKSRDFGLTWLACGYAIHGWLFRPGARYGFGSRKLELVDNSEDDKTIFAKLRFLLDNLPWWMTPRHLSKYCLLKNYDNGNTIAGEGGDEIGRGDRTSAFFVDEAASLAHPELTDAALSQTTNCRFDISTPKGVGNSFYKRRHSGAVPVFTCHWRDDPRKDDAWYQKQVETLDPVIVAQEIDIDYTASVEGICIPAKWARAAVDAHLKYPDWQWPQNGALRASADLAGGGANRNVLGFMRGVVLEEMLDWRHESQEYSAQKIWDECHARQVKSLYYDAGGGYGGAVADKARAQAISKDEGGRMKAEEGVSFAVRALNGGAPASNLRWPEKGDDGHQVTSREKFRNARAEWWWLLRERFRKTWEMAEGQKKYPVAELISIPHHGDLLADLSKPLVVPTIERTIALESKKDMAKRGVESPDWGDMLAMLMAPASADESLGDLKNWLKGKR
jgi:hypothetical protein